MLVMNMSRAKRKIEHIHHALEHDRDYYNHFDDIDIVHQSLAKLNFDELSLSVEVGELKLSSPLFINAMTGGGGERTEQINGDIALAASETGIGMAVGSQMSALKDPAERRSYAIVRENNPSGIIFANVGSEAGISQAKEAIEMIEADGLQIHVNTLQELIMPEGDRNFKTRMENIQRMVEGVSQPVIVKEVGFGMSKETVEYLWNLGVRYVDIGGRGGTNFSKVENLRREKPFSSFENWGIPTPISVLEAKSIHKDLHIIASGGIRHGVDGVKAMVLGGEAFGMAGTLLRVLLQDGRPALISEVEHILHEVKMAMMLMNARSIKELRHQPYVLSGKTREWSEQRK